MRRLVPFCLAILAIALLSTEALAELVLSGDIPDEAPRCSIVLVTVSTDEGHEWARVEATGMKLLRGWMDHYGWSGAFPGASIGSRASEWSMAYQGPPTWEFEVTGEAGTEATVKVVYIGGSYGLPERETETKTIKIGPQQPRIELEAVRTELRIDGIDSTVVKATVTECGEPQVGVEVTFTTDLGLLAAGDSVAEKKSRRTRSSRRGYTREDLFSKLVDYQAEAQKSASEGVTATTDTAGVARAVLYAHTPVIRSEVVRRPAVRLFNHGERRTATVRGSTESGTASVQVMEVPGDITFLKLAYDEFTDQPGRWGHYEAPEWMGDTLLNAEDSVYEVVIRSGQTPAPGPVGPTNVTTLMQRTTLQFLHDYRADPEQAAHLDGWDYVPIESVGFEGHKAVLLHKHGEPWESGIVLDPFWEKREDFYRLDGSEPVWPPLLLSDEGFQLDVDPALDGYYPATGGAADHYPWPDTVIPYEGETVHFMTHSPIAPLLTAADGNRIGILADGTAVAEVPGVLRRLVLPDGEEKYLLEVEARHAEGTFSVRGTGDGTFGLTVIRDRGGADPLGAAWRGLPIVDGEILDARIGESLFVPIVREGGTEIWPSGSEALDVLKGTLRVKGPGEDSAKLKARWLLGASPLDFAADDLVVEIGDLVFTIPAGAGKVSGSGKVSYKTVLEGGVGLKIAYSPKKGALKVSAKGLDLSEVEAGELEVRCTCGEREGRRTVRFVPKKSGLITEK